MKLAMRPALPKDAKQIAKLMKASADARESLSHYTKSFVIDSIETSIRERLKLIFLAIASGEPIGFIALTPLKQFRHRALLPTHKIQDAAIISGLIVRHDWRNTGVATNLAYYALRQVSKEFKHVYSDVAVENHSAIAVQKKLKMKESGQFVGLDKKQHIFFKRHISD